MKHLEIEQKYDAAAGFTVPELSELPGVVSVSAPESHHLHASYFDTEDLRLAAHGITLRRRRGGEDAGWHLKMPAGPDSKQELRAPLGRPLVVPARLSELVTAYTRGAPLRPVATLETNRTVIRLLGEEDEVLAEVADDAVIGRVLLGAEPAEELVDGIGPEVSGGPLPGGSKARADAGAEERGGVELAGTRLDGAAGGTAEGEVRKSSWREIEVELAAGERDLLKAAGKRLRKAGARRASSSSKLGRLLNGHQVKRPAAARDEGSAPTAGEAVIGYLAAQLRAILMYDPKARLAEDDAVHQMRVAVRRTRSALKNYRAVLDRKATDPLGEELKWLAGVLGEVRDLEVLRMRFAERLRELGEEAPGLLDDLVRQEKAAYRRMKTTLRQERYFAVLDALERLAAEPPLTKRARREAAGELPDLVTRSWRRLGKAYAAIETADDPEIARHDTRKAAKRARYAAEVAAPVLGGPTVQAARDAKKVQQVLGDYQDGVIATEYLRGAASRGVADAFTLGVLSGVELCEGRAALDRLADTWSAISEPRF